MSDTPDRRYEDKRLDRIDLTIETMQEDITYIKTRIDNGFSTSIKSTEDKVNYIDDRNREEHKSLSAKLDKILFLWVGGTISIAVGVIGYIIKEAIIK